MDTERSADWTIEENDTFVVPSDWTRDVGIKARGAILLAIATISAIHMLIH